MGEVDPKRRLADWFRQWRSPLRKFLLRRGSVPASDLDDIAQEVFLRLMRYDRTELIEHPQAYLFKMATNVAAAWAIRGRHMRAHEPKWLAELADESEVEDNAAHFELQDEIESVIGTSNVRGLLGPSRRPPIRGHTSLVPRHGLRGVGCLKQLPKPVCQQFDGLPQGAELRNPDYRDGSVQFKRWGMQYFHGIDRMIPSNKASG